MTIPMRTLAVPILVVLLAACASPRIQTDHDSNADFRAYRTFSWISPHPLLVSSATMVDPRLEAYLTGSTRAVLRARGYEFAADPAAADFYVGFTVGTPLGNDAARYPAEVRDNLMWRPPSSSGDGSRWLAVNVYDAATRQPVWRGTVRKDVTGRDQANAEAVLKGLVESVLAEFPPG